MVLDRWLLADKGGKARATDHVLLRYRQLLWSRHVSRQSPEQVIAMPPFSPEILVYGLAVGAVAGFAGGGLAGLAGVGGGFLYVPIFLLTMPTAHAGVMAPHIMASMVGVFLTGAVSSRVHWKLGHVDLVLLRRLLPWLIAGACLGLWSTLKLPAAVVLLALGGLDLWMAWDLGRSKQDGKKPVPLLPWMLPIGFTAGALGIGSGIMLVPLLRRHVALRQAVGTAAFCGFAMAGTAALVNLTLERDWLSLLAPNFWFLIGAWLGIAAIIPHSTRWGASFHHRWPESSVTMALRLLFATIGVSLLLQAIWRSL
jgi:uncharacterized protein